MCFFSQRLVRAVGRKGGMLLLRAPPKLQKGEERVHFGLDLVRGAAVSSQLCVDKRTSRWDVTGMGVIEFHWSVRHGGGKLPSGLEWRRRYIGKKE